MSAANPHEGDPTREVRPGEELDLAALSSHLAAHGFETPITVRQFPSGHSNLTYALRFADGREAVLRRPPFGAEKIARGHDMGREFRILAGVHPVWPRVPRPLLLCDEPSVIGTPFYLMERLHGTILRAPRHDLTPEYLRRASQTLLDTLVQIHDIDITRAGLDTLGHPAGYVARQVEGWTERHRRARTDDIPDIEHVAAWLAEHQPTESGATLVHNDFKYDNLVLAPDDLTRVTAILDWEMATVGDPLMDLGTALCYWVQADDPPELQAFAFGPTAAPGSYTRQGFAEHYARRTGRSLDAIPFYYAFGLFKTAVVAQQIYVRYVRGHTKDPRFAGFIAAVRALASQAERALERQRL